MIPYGRQDISAEDIDSVCEVLRSDFLTQGPKVPELEKAIALKSVLSMQLQLTVQPVPFISLA